MSLNVYLMTVWVNNRGRLLEGCVNIIDTGAHCGGRGGGALHHWGGEDDANVDVAQVS